MMVTLLAVAIISIISLLGGALGAVFGFGFLGNPITRVSISGETLFSVGGYHITNTFMVFWVVGALVVGMCYLGTRRMRLVPTGLQNLLEVVIEGMISVVESAGGPAARRFLPLTMSIFIVVFAVNLVEIVPFVDTVGKVETVQGFLKEHAVDDSHAAILQAAKDNSKIDVTVFKSSGWLKYIPFGYGQDTRIPISAIAGDPPTLENIEAGVVINPPADHPELKGKSAGFLVPAIREANADLNTTLAIAIVAIIAIEYWGISTLGLGTYLSRFLNFKHGPMHFAVGLLEMISEVAKVISLTFRLFGNMFAGSILLLAMGFLFPLVGTVPFLGLELFVSFIQAFIFAMLTLVFAIIATTHMEEI